LPRKYWTMKNRYCWNANLGEDMFLCLLKLYCEGRNCSQATRIIARYARRHCVKALSRQTASRYYLLFGDYCYAALPQEYDFLHVDLERGEQALADRDYSDGYSQQLILMALHQTLYGKLEWNDTINKLLISNKTQDVYNDLVMQSKSKHGIPIETFCAHFAFCMWQSLIQTLRPGVHPSRALYVYMKELMEESPIGSFEMRRIRLVRNR